VRGFLLGLANGTACLVFCAPVLIPFLLQEGHSARRNLATLLQFLGGRLGGYLLLGLAAWATGSLLLQASPFQSLIVGATYVGLAALLLVTVLRRRATAGACALEGAQSRLAHWPALLPAAMGFLAGLKLCPPVLLAFADAAHSGTLAGGLLLFLMFFLGTSIYFLPFSFLGALSRVSALRFVGKVAAAVVALYYLVAGVLMLAGGVI